MRATLAIILLLSGVACSTSHLGACTRDADCPAYATCDSSRSVCVLKRGVCFPACDASHVCDPATQTCRAATTPSVAITSPAPGGYAAGTLQATAVATAPGGVTGLTFNLSIGGSVVASANAAVSPTDPTSWSATLSLAGVPDGPVDLIATIAFPGGSASSAKVSLTVDQTPPSISMQTDGRTTFYTGGQTDTVAASITDVLSGVKDSTVALLVNGHSIPGVAGAGGTYSFAVVIDDTVLAAGTSATVAFTITAGDNAGNTFTLSGDPKQVIRADRLNSGPLNISIFADPTPYARTAIPVPVSALITSSAGVPDGGAFLNGTVAPSFRDGGLFTFQLDARGAPAGVEGPYGFQVSATDNSSATADAGGTRFIDDAPPSLTIQIYKDVPDGGVVTYPAAVANTGWTGNSFIYSDTVHVKGTITDLGGIGAATLHVDGIDLDGGVTTGVSRSLGCTLGSGACSFDLQVALNDPQNGAFHTGTAMSDAGVAAGEAIPSGFMQLTIAASDQAVAGDGTPSPHAGSNATPSRATRLLWQQQVASGNVTGLAVHASGDVIATTSGTGNSVYDLAPDHPAVRWSFNAGLGVPDQPAIGAGTPSLAAIYVASSGGFIDALAPDGGVLWQADAGLATGATFGVGPAVDSAAWTDGGAAEQAVVPDNNAGASKLWAASSANSNTPFSVASDNVDTFSSPMVFQGFVWFGDGVNGASGNVSRHPMVGDGSFGAAAVVGGLQPRPYWGLVTDGTTVFAATVRPTQTTRLDMYSITSLFATGWDTTTAHLAAEPTIGIDGKLLASDRSAAHAVSKVATSTGAFTTLLTLGATSVANSNPIGGVPLQGSDGHVYVLATLSASNANVLAVEGNQLSWELLLPSSTLARAAAMDCSGRLFVGDGNTVYALITDDHGLADTPWPNQRRDARNTGNANAPRYGIRTTGNVCLQ